MVSNSILNMYANHCAIVFQIEDSMTVLEKNTAVFEKGYNESGRM